MTREEKARRAAFEVFQMASASGLGHAASVEAATAKYRTIVPEASGYEVRKALATALEEELAMLRSQRERRAG
jgi:hypothetical protein